MGTAMRGWHILALAVAVLPWVVLLLLRSDPPPPVAGPPPEVLRRLELRIVDVDRTHPVAGGERYRLFECREVPRR